jgi:hypothetical protein
VASYVAALYIYTTKELLVSTLHSDRGIAVGGIFTQLSMLPSEPPLGTPSLTGKAKSRGLQTIPLSKLAGENESALATRLVECRLRGLETREALGRLAIFEGQMTIP